MTEILRRDMFAVYNIDIQNGHNINNFKYKLKTEMCKKMMHYFIRFSVYINDSAQ